MMGPQFHRAALALIFAAGVGAIMATSYIPEKYITELAISPQNRCAGSDVRVSWTTNKPTGLSVEINNVPYRLGNIGEYTVPAEIFDATDSSTRLKFSLPDGPRDYWSAKWVQTYGEAAPMQTKLLETDSSGFEYSFRFEPETWDSRFLVSGVTIVSTPEILCTAPDGQASWNIKKDGQNVATASNVSGSITEFYVPVSAVGKWYFISTSSPQAPICKAPPGTAQCENCRRMDVKFHLTCSEKEPRS